MGYVPDWSRQDHKKTSGGKSPEGIKHGTSLFHGKQSPARTERARAFLADGGDVEEAALKAEGLESSKGESVGLWDRLKAGNIDEVGSEAYNRFGAGRAKADRDEVTRLSNRAEAASADAASSYDESPAETARLVRQSEPVKPAMTAADFQRTDKDTTPVPMPSRRRSAPKPTASPARASDATPELNVGTGSFPVASEPEKKASAPASKGGSGSSLMDTTPVGLAKSIMKGGVALGAWLRGSRSPETPEERQSRLKAAGTPSGGRAGASLMDRGRVSGNYADGGMVKGKKRKC